jgi:hypothetical protein
VNSSLELLKVALKQRGFTGPLNAVAEEMCKIIDHFNQQHWSDRNRYGEEIKQLKAKIAKLEKTSEPE